MMCCWSFVYKSGDLKQTLIHAPNIDLRPADNLHRYAARKDNMDPIGWRVKISGYRDEPDANQESSTETFTALKIFIDNWRCQVVLLSA
jgi:hypothetical protein